MWRAAIVTAIVYTWGSPMFDGTRPPVVDIAVKAFHAEVNTATKGAAAEVRRLQSGTVGPMLPPFRAAAD